MVTIGEREPSEPKEHDTPVRVPVLLLAGEPEDDGSEPHICRGID
ncbi:hypothetical protein ACIOD0_02595 [Kitasatospora albolonga]|uniref:Uncharacterized protein n=1 Tax=Streptomyces stephensoniae TaxID=3375367 RepID=A0ABU2W9Q2_9ACTN|nr:hypothetical protein [Streptomyces griseus]MDT0494354.1 hypothetical protein [Streptomyces griseus]